MRLRTYLLTLLLPASSITLRAQDGKQQDLIVIPQVDLQKYAGTWYEIARLPNRFQDMCVSDVSATYILDDDEIVVVNRCRKENGDLTEATGRARRSGDDQPNTKLKVRFAPAFLSFLPFVWGNYWIIDLARDYSFAVIGEPDRQYLWILSRTKTLPGETLPEILKRIRQQGYDTTKLVYTKQTQG